MALNLRQIQLSQRRVPLEQIVAVKGQNPVATGIDQAGAIVGKALERRAQLRQQAQVVSALANAAGEQNPGVEGIDPATFETLVKLKTERAAKSSQAAKDRVAQELAMEKLRTGYTEHDAMTGLDRSYPGVQGLSIKYDPAGNPFIERGLDYVPAALPKSGGSSGASQSGYWTPRGSDPLTGRPVYSHSKRPGLFYDENTPYDDSHGQIFKLTPQPLPSEQVTQQSGLGTLDLALKRIEDSYKPEYVGPISSRIGKLGQYSDYTADSEKGNFYSSVGDLRNQIVYLRSGKQINEEEYKRLMATLPNEGTSPTDFKMRLTNTKQMLQVIRRERAKALQQSGYRAGTGGGLPILPAGNGGSIVSQNDDPMGILQ